MNISRENIDELNAVVKVDIAKEDYQPKVEKILKDYRKTASIPGFRKGHVPMGLVQKQYGQAVLVDEVNKLLQDNLNNYLFEEKLEFLGNPLPKEQENFSWEEENYTFEFELGLAPQFTVDLKSKKPITYYKIVADEEMIENQIKSIRSQYGKLKSKTQAENDDLVTGVFKSEENEIDNRITFSLDKVKGKRNTDKFLNAKIGDTLNFKTKNLFTEDYLLANYLGLDADKAKDLNVEVDFELQEINEQELAAMDKELFAKVFGEDANIETEEEFVAKLKEDFSNQFKQQGDQQLINDITEYLIENTEFDLPKEFLQKWIRVSGEKELTEEEAAEEYERSEKGIRFQLIENQIFKDNNLKVEMEDVLSLTKERIKMQMAQFGHLNPTEEELDSISRRVLTNEHEARNMSDQVKTQKLLAFYKENANLKEKEIGFDDFIKEMTKDNK